MNLAAANQVVERFHGFLDGRLGVPALAPESPLAPSGDRKANQWKKNEETRSAPAVNLVEINIGGSKARERRIDSRKDVLAGQSLVVWTLTYNISWKAR
jgi:hypothetical protein